MRESTALSMEARGSRRKAQQGEGASSAGRKDLLCQVRVEKEGRLRGGSRRGDLAVACQALSAEPGLQGLSEDVED